MIIHYRKKERHLFLNGNFHPLTAQEKRRPFATWRLAWKMPAFALEVLTLTHRGIVETRLWLVVDSSFQEKTKMWKRMIFLDWKLEMMDGKWSLKKKLKQGFQPQNSGCESSIVVKKNTEISSPYWFSPKGRKQKKTPFNQIRLLVGGNDTHKLTAIDTSICLGGKHVFHAWKHWLFITQPTFQPGKYELIRVSPEVLVFFH